MRTETKINGCKIQKPKPKKHRRQFFDHAWFSFLLLPSQSNPPHEINIDLNLKFRTGIINNAFVLLLGKDYSQSKAYSPN